MAAGAVARKPVVLYDGACSLCHRSVQFLVARDREAVLAFAAMQSGAGEALRRRFGLPPSVLDTMVLVAHDRCYTRSAAWLKIMRMLPYPWKLAYGLIAVPAFIRDAVYTLIARKRYRWWGKLPLMEKDETCPLPDSDLRSRTLS